MSRLLLTITVFLTMLTDFQAMGQTKEEFAPAINISGRQRMLSQKMALETLLLQLKIGADEGPRNATMKLFEDSLQQLTQGDP